MSRLIRNIRFSIFEQAVLAVHVFVAIALIRYLGPEQFGTYSYYLSIAGIVSVLTFNGFSNLYVRDIAQNPDNESLTQALLLLNFLGALFAVVVLFAYYAIFADSPRLSPALMAFTAFSTFQCIKFTLRDYFIARQEFRIVSLLTAGLFVISVAMKILGILVELPLVYFFFLFSFDTVLAIVAFGTAYGWRRAFSFDGTDKWIKYLFINGWPSLLAGLSFLIFMKIDQVLLFHLRSEQELGAYASLMWLIEKTFIFTVIIMTAFFPYLSEKHASDRAHYHKAVRVGHKLFASVSIPIAVFFIANHEALVAKLFGHRFAIDSYALSFLAGAMLFVYWGAINQKVLVITNALKLDLFYAGSSALVSLALNFLLIPRFGIVGAAMAALAAHSFYFWAQLFVPSHRRYNTDILLSIPAPLAMALASLIISRLLGGGVFSQGLLYLGAYTLLFIWLLRSGLSDEYGTISRLFFTKLIRFRRGNA